MPSWYLGVDVCFLFMKNIYYIGSLSNATNTQPCKSAHGIFITVIALAVLILIGNISFFILKKTFLDKTVLKINFALGFLTCILSFVGAIMLSVGFSQTLKTWQDQDQFSFQGYNLFFIAGSWLCFVSSLAFAVCNLVILLTSTPNSNDDQKVAVN